MPSSLPISICAAASSEGIGSLIIEVAERGCCSNLFIAKHRIASSVYNNRNVRTDCHIICLCNAYKAVHILHFTIIRMKRTYSATCLCLCYSDMQFFV